MSEGGKKLFKIIFITMGVLFGGLFVVTEFFLGEPNQPELKTTDNSSVTSNWTIDEDEEDWEESFIEQLPKITLSDYLQKEASNLLIANRLQRAIDFMGAFTHSQSKKPIEPFALYSRAGSAK